MTPPTCSRDELTAGGPVYGTRWYVVGAPDAGKTALLIRIAHDYFWRGVAVGLLAVDEDPTDIVTRFAQRGVTRSCPATAARRASTCRTWSTTSWSAGHDGCLAPCGFRIHFGRSSRRRRRVAHPVGFEPTTLGFEVRIRRGTADARCHTMSGFAGVFGVLGSPADDAEGHPRTD